MPHKHSLKHSGLCNETFSLLAVKKSTSNFVLEILADPRSTRRAVCFGCHPLPPVPGKLKKKRENRSKYSCRNSSTTDVKSLQEVKVSDRGWPCHEFEPSTTKHPPCRGVMRVKSVESRNVLPLQAVHVERVYDHRTLKQHEGYWQVTDLVIWNHGQRPTFEDIGDVLLSHGQHLNLTLYTPPISEL
ncbi:hypothetical protein TNCV_3159831 [Trichonephila clavipes]|nr:hypothetical protein TNCV_3159831 [Trichonephila clavipes]